MKLADYDYDLPSELIAQAPPRTRSSARLLVVASTDSATAGACFDDRCVTDLPQLLQPGDLLVFNDTRVVPARLAARRPTGGRVELLLERAVAGTPDEALVQLRSSKGPHVGERLESLGGPLRVLGREGGLWRIGLPAAPLEFFERFGSVPLPPYITRAPDASDRERYQSLFARAPGAVAAPTASLHFDEPLLAALDARGVARTFVTLHVGAGTFLPVRSADPARHRMHAEWIEVGAQACEAIRAARVRGARVVAVGTTVVRALESAAAAARGEPVPQPFIGDTRLFIRPGHTWRCVDAFVTNFHLPRSTLLMLVAAFAGRDTVLAAYQHAVARRYRFFSYGDAMFLTRTATAASS